MPHSHHVPCRLLRGPLLIAVAGAICYLVLVPAETRADVQAWLGPLLLAVISGEMDFQLASALSAMPHVKSGRLRILGVTSLERSSLFPDLPTVASIYPGFANYNWYGLFLPVGVPKDIAQKLHAEFIKALNAPEVREFLAREGATPVGNTPEEFAAYLKADIAKWRKVIADAKIPKI